MKVSDRIIKTLQAVNIIKKPTASRASMVSPGVRVIDPVAARDAYAEAANNPEVKKLTAQLEWRLATGETLPALRAAERAQSIGSRIRNARIQRSIRRADEAFIKTNGLGITRREYHAGIVAQRAHDARGAAPSQRLASPPPSPGTQIRNRLLAKMSSETGAQPDSLMDAPGPALRTIPNLMDAPGPALRQSPRPAPVNGTPNLRPFLAAFSDVSASDRGLAIAQAISLQTWHDERRRGSIGS